MSNNENVEQRTRQAEAFHALSEYVSPAERKLLDRVLSHPDRPLTFDFLSEQGDLSGLAVEHDKALLGLADTVGLPVEGENVETTIVPLGTLVEGIQAARASRAGYPHNNEFALFVHDQDKALGEGTNDLRPATLRSVICPPFIRLKALFPGLVTGMKEYGQEHPRLHDFYDGLTERDSESAKALLMFAVCDQLMQRLTRPHDAQYELACFDEILRGKGKDYTPPKYNALDTDPTDPSIVTNAHDYLY